MSRFRIAMAFFFLALPLFAMAADGAALAGEGAVEEAAPKEAGALDFFSVLSLSHAARSGEVPWRPDWPLDMPPDAFVPLERGSALTLIRGEGDEMEDLRARRNQEGLLVEFPLFWDSEFFPVQTLLDPRDLIQGFSIVGKNPWEILILEYAESLPSLVRINQGESMYFAILEYANTRVTEIWYDRDGKALAVFSFQFDMPGGRVRRITLTDIPGEMEGEALYHYDSMENISGLDFSGAVYAALYVGHGRPRYWNRSLPPIPETEAEVPERVDHFALQWDEQGLLTRITGILGGGEERDIRYEYSRDEGDLWVERRETRMIRRSGFLIPSPGERVIRRIEYPEPEARR
jgi:hypothetical protein